MQEPSRMDTIGDSYQHTTHAHRDEPASHRQHTHEEVVVDVLTNNLANEKTITEKTTTETIHAQTFNFFANSKFGFIFNF